MAGLALGIDTGGTFTDGVIYNLGKKEIVKYTKVITKRHNLLEAINDCLSSLLAGEKALCDSVKMVSLSTTLATNAIVEGQGVEVGLILIGFRHEKEFPTSHVVGIKGGCNIKGKPKEELDIQEIRTSIEKLRYQVDAFAISGYLSIRNPAQEKEVEKLVRETTGYPVVCAHQLSTDLGFYERTVTAVLNARLMPLITNLIFAVKESMKKKGIDAPLMVVRGNGSLISAEKALEIPIETLLSGPAASIVGAMTLTGIKEGIVADMGGTTTDVAVFKAGRPLLSQRGARVGDWLTHVKAAAITTAGIGGDSIIQVKKNRELLIGPQRVFPLAWVGAAYPHLFGELEEIKANGYFPLNSQPTTILTYIRAPLHLNPTPLEQDILDLVKEGPHTLYHLSKILGKDADILNWERLVKVGSIHRASLTPTDLLHITGDFEAWDKEIASLGLDILACRFQTTKEAFIDAVMKRIYFQLSVLILEALLVKQGRRLSKKDEGTKFFLSEFFGDPDTESEVVFTARSRLPFIAVGAPAQNYFPVVARKFGAKLCLPPFAAVANAVGTVIGKILETLNIVIKPGENGGFLVHTPTGRKGFLDFDDAVLYGEELGRSYVQKQARASGAREIEVTCNRKDKYSKIGTQASDDLFIESIIEIVAVGRPWQ